MSDTPTRRSPIHSWLEARQPEWRIVNEMSVAIKFQAAEAEKAAMSKLALCDLSALTKLGVKGRDAENWLSQQSVDLPAGIYESQRLADGGLIARLAADEFLMESGISNETVPAVAARLTAQDGQVFQVVRQESTFLLIGSDALDVLTQTCGVDFRETPPLHLVLTRVAGVSCGVLPDPVGDTWACRIWIDYTYAVYLWETLVQICEDLDGSVIGAGCIFPEFR